MPSTGDFWECSQHSSTGPAAQKGQERTSPWDHQEWLHLQLGLPVVGWEYPHQLSRLLHLCLACSRACDKESLWRSLQRHREELVPRLAADLLSVHA